MNTNTPLPSDITILDNLLASNLNISLWSARKKLTPQDFGKDDFGTVELTPEDLATLGSKRMAPPESLRIFGTLKARAFNFLDRHGIRFMSGWAIPEDKAAEVIQELMTIRDEFLMAKEACIDPPLVSRRFEQASTNAVMYSACQVIFFAAMMKSALLETNQFLGLDGLCSISGFPGASSTVCSSCLGAFVRVRNMFFMDVSKTA